MKLAEDYSNFSMIYRTSVILLSFFENWSNAENFEMRLRTNKHADISFYCIN